MVGGRSRRRLTGRPFIEGSQSRPKTSGSRRLSPLISERPFIKALDQIIELRGTRGALDRVAARVREHCPEAAADADARQAPERVARWLYEVTIDHPAAFDAAMRVA
jgi:hypothetical protein